jgi:hypothetical protein
LYTNCTGAGARNNEIYGQVTHLWGGIEYAITAGLSMNTAGNYITQPGIYSGSMEILSGTVGGLLYDTH